MILTMPDSLSNGATSAASGLGGRRSCSPLAVKGMVGAIERAQQLRPRFGSHIPDQFDNPANPEAHYCTTGPEILQDMDGWLDLFVAGTATAAPSPA